MQKVWRRSLDGWWYATLREAGGREQIKLLKAADTPDARKRAEDCLVRELAARIERGQAPEGSPEWLTVAHVIAGFLAHSAQEHDKDAHRWYKGMLAGFTAKWGTLRVAMLRKQQVLSFVKAKYDNPTSQNKAIGAIKRAFNWAVEEEHIARNPIAHVRKPKPRVRDRILSPEERALIVASIRDQPFADYFLALTLTGCRPGEVAKVTAEQVSIERGIWILPIHKTAKRTGKPRIIYLSPEALALTRRLVASRPTGPLFRNRNGLPWNRNAVRMRFRTLRRRFPQLKGVVAYTCRSTFATDALEAGVSDAAVAELLGHTNTETLHKFYARLSHRVEHLREAAAKATRQRQSVLPVFLKIAGS